MPHLLPFPVPAALRAAALCATIALAAGASHAAPSSAAAAAATSATAASIPARGRGVTTCITSPSRAGPITSCTGPMGETCTRRPGFVYIPEYCVPELWPQYPWKQPVVTLPSPPSAEGTQDAAAIGTTDVVTGPGSLPAAIADPMAATGPLAATGPQPTNDPLPASASTPALAGAVPGSAAGASTNVPAPAGTLLLGVAALVAMRLRAAGLGGRRRAG